MSPAALADLQRMVAYLAAHRRPVFPCAPGGKEPACKGGLKAATCDLAQLKMWWRTRAYNIGMTTGKGLVVVDCDTPTAKKKLTPPWDTPGITSGHDVLHALAEQAGGATSTFATRIVETPSGGVHYYFRTTGPDLRNTSGRLGPLLDTRGAGGYVIVPPSTTDAGTYTTTNPGPIADLPTWLHNALATPPATTPPPALPGDRGTPGTPRGVAYATAALHAELDTVLAATEGTRNHTLNAAAYNLGQLTAAGHLDHAVVTTALATAARSIGLSQTEADRTITSGLAAGGKTPRQVAS